MTLQCHSSRARPRWVALVGLVMIFSLMGGATTLAHPDVSLTGSNFEIDTDANLKLDHSSSYIDWASVNETRREDSASGPSDESFGQGTKEDTAVPSVADGGIPPNKSDLKFFGVYQEGATATGFLNLFWSRVQDPSGTTNMDFEFNQSNTLSSNGVTPVRTAGDLLVIYDLSQGGTHPTLSKRTWNGSAWGSATGLTSGTDATGSINTSSIPDDDSDGLGIQDPRTFGEAQLRLSSLFDANVCQSYGSVYLKSRSSDSFNSALKDFVPPVAVNISNCGSIKVIKTAKHAGAGSADLEATFTVKQDGEVVNTITTNTTTGIGCRGGYYFGSYTVEETSGPAGYKLDPDTETATVSASGTCPSAASATVSFENVPLTDITVSVDSQVTGGTKSTITCANATPTYIAPDPADDTPTALDDTSETVKNLVPGTYTCTVVIDP